MWPSRSSPPVFLLLEKAEVLALGVKLYRKKPMGYEETVELARELIEICKGDQRSADATSSGG